MIAIIAGTGRLPIHACQSLLQKKKPFFVIALFPEDNLEQLNKTIGSQAEVIAQKFYKAGAIKDLLQQKNTRQVLFIGKVDKRNLLSHVKFDWFTVKFLASLIGSKSDSAIMERIVQEFNNYGMEVISQADVLDALMVPPGILCGTLKKEDEANIAMGINMAIKLSECDIGQTVAVKDNMILAVEAIEGTDACIKRAIDLGKNNVVICKAARSTQNKKFDLPTLGPSSLKDIQPGQVAAIAWLSTHTFIADQEEFVHQAQKLGITLVSYELPRN